MLCPYCREPLSELSPECPGCKLELRRAAALLGPIPQIEAGICDQVEALDRRSYTRIRRRIERIDRRFPQVRIQILCRSFPRDHPLALYAFWIFNLGGISIGEEKGGDNHTVLLTLDPLAKKSAITIGYGIEPFIGEADLERLLDLGESAWQEKEWGQGILRVLDGLELLFESVIRELSSVFELPTSPDDGESREY